MQDQRKFSISQLFNFAQGSYLERTSRPIYAIAFLLPFIVFYELGTILINTDVLDQSQVRVVAFVWLQNLLDYLGFGSKLAWVAPPLAVIIILAALQLASRKRWSFNLSDIWPMAIECVLLAIPLIVLSLALNSNDQPQYDSNHVTISPAEIQMALPANVCAITAQAPSKTDTPGFGSIAAQSILANIVTGIGAGIYEELIFRLILICLLMVLFQDLLRFSRTHAIIFSVLISAALFSAHHHVVFLDGRFGLGAPFNATEFGFRTAAGVYFATLFAARGFGITAGTHAFYDIIAVLVNTFFFHG